MVYLDVQNAGAGKKLATKMANKEPVLLLIHAHWCPHCVSYMGNPPTQSYPWAQVHRHLDQAFKGEVACGDVESEKMTLLPPGIPPVQGFPTLLFIQGDYKEEFQGNRQDKKAVEAFVKRAMRSAKPAAAKKPVAPVKRAMTAGATKKRTVALKTSKKNLE